MPPKRDPDEFSCAWGIEAVVKDSGRIVDQSCFRKRMKALREKAEITKWKNNGLRHSFGPYHLQQFGDDTQTAKEMGHVGTDMIHNHYKALVSTKAADAFWKLMPQRP